MTALAGTADRLSAGDLTARVAPSGTPELRRVGLELNRLATRIQELLPPRARRWPTSPTGCAPR